MHDQMGKNGFRYKIDRNWVKASYADLPVKNCHGIVEDQSGRIILLNNHPAHNVIILSKEGEVLSRWGREYPEAHGLEMTRENGEEFLWITDCKRALVVKTTLEGRVVKSLGFDAVSHLYSSREKFVPTNVAITPEGDFYLSDGYGDSWIHHFDPQWKHIGSFGGEKGLPSTLNGAHAVWYDDRDPKNRSVWVCSRREHSLKQFSPQHEFMRSISLGSLWPCNIHYSQGLFYIPHLKNDPHEHGVISIHDDHFNFLECLGADLKRDPLGKMESTPESDINPFVYPHDLHVDSKGNIYLAQWYSGGTHPIKLERMQPL